MHTNNKLNTQNLLNLFEKFSLPLVKSAVTKHQKEVSIGIAKTLWLLLVRGVDTEKNVYNALSQILNNNHESNIAIGSLYFFKMKIALSGEEIKLLYEFYDIDDNFNALENWLNELH
jgi:hypothetical protein